MRPATPVVVVLASLAMGCGGGTGNDKEIEAAKDAYSAFKSTGADLSHGPCIADRLAGFADWAADIAHDPRSAADDDPTNQCSSYSAGETHHFVELDPDGDLIRAQ